MLPHQEGFVRGVLLIPKRAKASPSATGHSAKLRRVEKGGTPTSIAQADSPRGPRLRGHPWANRRFPNRLVCRCACLPQALCFGGRRCNLVSPNHLVPERITRLIISVPLLLSASKSGFLFTPNSSTENPEECKIRSRYGKPFSATDHGDLLDVLSSRMFRRN